MHGLKFFVKLEVICILFFARFENSLLYNQMYISSRKIIVGNKRFKVKNYLLKKNSGDFLKIVIKLERKSL